MRRLTFLTSALGLTMMFLSACGKELPPGYAKVQLLLPSNPLPSLSSAFLLAPTASDTCTGTGKAYGVAEDGDSAATDVTYTATMKNFDKAASGSTILTFSSPVSLTVKSGKKWRFGFVSTTNYNVSNSTCNDTWGSYYISAGESTMATVGASGTSVAVNILTASSPFNSYIDTTKVPTGWGWLHVKFASFSLADYSAASGCTGTDGKITISLNWGGGNTYTLTSTSTVSFTSNYLDFTPGPFFPAWSYTLTNSATGASITNGTIPAGGGGTDINLAVAATLLFGCP